jgi:ELWxxDGT repeat protein
MVKDISPGVMSSDPHALVAVGKNIFFFAWDQVHGNELWKSDGTADGTIQVKDITPGSGSTVMYAYDNHINAKAVQLADKLYMELNQQLWVSDGTDTGTHQLSNPAISDVTAFDNLTVVQNTLWFNGTNYRYGKELYAGAVTPATLPLYVFNGSGDFSDPANWLDNQVPPRDILKGMEVRITPQGNGEFILNQPIHFNGGKLTIAAGAKIVLNNLIIR